MLYQEGLKEDELLKRLHHAAFTARLSRVCYNKRDATVAAVVEAIERATKSLGGLLQNMQSRKSPLLLLPLNFGDRSIGRLFNRAISEDDPKPAMREFDLLRYVKDKSKRYYLGRTGLGFPPALPQEQHGEALAQDKVDLALTKQFRLGCYYNNGHHYDVFRTDGSEFDGSIIFYCRKNGDTRPKGTHVNVYVDDCLR